MSAVISSRESDFALSNKVPLIWVRLGNTTHANLISQFDAEWARMIQALADGENLMELDCA